MSQHQHGRGREVEDDELFGTQTTCPKRRRTTAQLSIPSKQPPIPTDNLRKSLPPGPRTHAQSIANFSNTPHLTDQELDEDSRRFQHAPRLSNLALAAARRLASSGQFRDLSNLPDQFIFDIFSSPALTYPVLADVERCNPQRVRVMEALWAGLVVQTYKIRELPAGVLWWRSLYEWKKEEEESVLERARERLRIRYSEGEAGRQSTKRATARTISKSGLERRRRGGAGSSSVPQTMIGRLRNEFRKSKSRR